VTSGVTSGVTNGVPSEVPSEVPGEAQARLGPWRQADPFGRPVGMAAAALAETVDVTGAETGLAATPLRAPRYCMPPIAPGYCSLRLNMYSAQLVWEQAGATDMLLIAANLFAFALGVLCGVYIYARLVLSALQPATLCLRQGCRENPTRRGKEERTS